MGLHDPGRGDLTLSLHAEPVEAYLGFFHWKFCLTVMLVQAVKFTHLDVVCKHVGNSAGSQDQESQDAAGAAAARDTCGCAHHHQRDANSEQLDGDALAV